MVNQKQSGGTLAKLGTYSFTLSSVYKVGLLGSLDGRVAADGIHMVSAPAQAANVA